MISDAQVSAEYLASPWERMAAEAARGESVAAMEELLSAELEDFHEPSVDTSVRVAVARTWVLRVEGRLHR